MKIHFIKALTDNYIYILESTGTNKVIVIDPSLDQPVIDFCEGMQLTPTHIINTHHHWDHVDGNDGLAAKYNCEVLCYESDKDRVPAMTTTVQDGELIQIYDWQFEVLHIPGHTTGQIALYNEKQKAVFVGDTMFRFGCGRLFEGDATQMWNSFQKLANLPKNTLVYCGHEYGLRNLEFLKLHSAHEKSVLADLKSRLEDEIDKTGRAVPFSIEEQIQYSPFMMAKDPQEFQKWRGLRDHF